jgi:hypothetical protein
MGRRSNVIDHVKLVDPFPPTGGPEGPHYTQTEHEPARRRQSDDRTM